MAAERTLRLNFFQRMMLRWRALHPYNPVHVLHLPLPLDVARLRQAIAAQLEALGLSGLQLDERRGRYRYTGGPASVDLRVVDAGGDAERALQRTIEAELNRPFVAGSHENPLRFVAIDEDDAYRLVLAYDHYLAGGEAVARLLLRLAAVLLGDSAATALPAPAVQDTARYRDALLRHPGWLLRALLELPRTVAQGRRVWRLRAPAGAECSNGYRALRLGGAPTRALRATAARWGVTVHELLSACLLQALAPLAAQRASQPRRNQLAVASIMNMRRDLPPDARDGLAPFLAAYRVTHPVPAQLELRELAYDVHRQTSRVRQRHVYLQSLLGLAVSALAWRWLTPAQRGGFYAKHFPVQAGITSIDLNRLWADGAATAARVGYLRAVPTGPLCPLVLAATQLRDELHLGIAFRSGNFSHEAVERLAAQLLHQIELASVDVAA